MSQGSYPYIAHVRGVEQRLGSGEEALRRAVGGEFEAVGQTGVLSLALFGINHGTPCCRCGSRQPGAATGPG